MVITIYFFLPTSQKNRRQHAHGIIRQKRSKQKKNKDRRKEEKLGRKVNNSKHYLNFCTKG